MMSRKRVRYTVKEVLDKLDEDSGERKLAMCVVSFTTNRRSMPAVRVI